MDCSISANYQNIAFSFRLKFWEVSSAIHISSGTEVSIWKFNYHELQTKYSENEISSFLSKYRNSLVASQHIHHFNILHIFEISDEKDPLSFSSERISSPFSQEKNLTNDEASFMISQLCMALNYLHQELHVAHFAISPDNILLSPHFNLKLANLVHFAKFSENNSIIEPNLYPLNTSIFDIDSRFASPEIKDHNPLTSSCDVYSFALFVIYVFTNEIPSKTPIDVSKLHIPDDLKEMIKQCLLTQPDKRPTFEQILADPSMNPVSVCVLNFIPKISKSPLEVRQNFYKKLSGIISDYSPRILSLKFVPIMVKEIIDDKELAQQLLPILLIASEKISAPDIYKLILQPLFKNEQYANYFFEKALTITNASIFVPILLSAYQSDIPSISGKKNELLKSINALENITSIIDMIGSIEDENVIESILQVCEGKIEPLDSSLFIQQLKQLYKKFSTNSAACTSIAHALLKIKPNSEYASKAVSLSLNLTKSFISKSDKESLIQFVERFLVSVRESFETESTESLSVSSNQSSNQNLLLIDDDVEILSPRKSKKEKKHKDRRDKKTRRSSLSSAALKKLDLQSVKNNSFSNPQKLFALPRGINPLSTQNVYIREVDLFAFREYINAETPAFTIKDGDPFEILAENRRRNSEIATNTSSDNEDEAEKKNEPPKIESLEIKTLESTPVKKKKAKINKSHRRSLSTQDILDFSNLDGIDENEPFGIQGSNSILQLSSSPNDLGSLLDDDNKDSNEKSDDDSGPFKVSKKNSLLSSSMGFGFSSLKKSYSSSNNIVNPLATAPNITNRSQAEIPNTPSEDVKRRRSAGPNTSLNDLINGKDSRSFSARASNDDSIISQSRSKSKNSRTKSRPYIPTPPMKKVKKGTDE